MEITRRGFFGLIGAAIAAKPALDYAQIFGAVCTRPAPEPALTVAGLQEVLESFEALRLQPSVLIVSPELYQVARVILDESSAPVGPGDIVFASPYVAQSYRLTGSDWFKVTRAG